MVMSGQSLNLFVAPNGNDAGSGAAAAPFATLERARDEIRKLKKAGLLPSGGVTVEMAPGVYELTSPFKLAAKDSGTVEAPIIYRAKTGMEVRLVGGRQITDFQPVTAPDTLTRLDEGARGKVLMADLKALGVSDFGDPSADGKRHELFFQDKPMTVARWPNEGFVRIVDVVGGAPHRIHGVVGDKVGMFSYEGDRPSRWIGEKDPWLHGYWFWDWAEQRHRIDAIDTERKVITLAPPAHTYGYRKNQWYYAFNLLAELDVPGEYYLDREAGILYFWPPAPIDQGTALLSISPRIIECKDASHITFRGFILEAACGSAVTISGGRGVLVASCVIRNTGNAGVDASGHGHGVVGCDIYETAGGGVNLTGGDRKSLTPGGLFAENNHIHHYARWTRMYRPGITLHGVGNRASYNLIDNAPHMAMGFGGNDHLIEFNEIHSVCYESNDAGAIYAGRNWSMRGTIIRHNYFHHINGFEGRGCVGVYLDDQFCGTLVYGNVFCKVTRAAMIGGGRDCVIENNVFVDCVPATHVDARGLGWAARGGDGLRAGLEDMPYKTPPWSERYPQLPTLLEDDPMAPKGNVIARNICVGGRCGDFEAKAKPLVMFTDNLIDQDPKFVDAGKLNFQLKDDSPAFAVGFTRIPVEQIGLRKDADRVSWPVVHEVRPMATPPGTPPKPARKDPVVFKAPRTAAPVEIDGVLAPAEWCGLDPAKGMLIEQGIQGEKVSPTSGAWIQWDDAALYVAFSNSVSAKFPIRPGDQWGQDDAVEIAIRDTSAGKDAPILVLRGFPSGFFQSVEEAGAPAAAAKRAVEGVGYKAKIVDATRWTAEWRIPFASLGIDPAKRTRFAFNLSVRKSADDLWLLWQGTGACTWEVGNAGILELSR